MLDTEALRNLSHNDEQTQASCFDSLDKNLAPYLVHHQDAVIAREMVLVALTSALGVYAAFHFTWLSASLYGLAWLLNGPAIAVFLHATSHRRLFRGKLSWLNSAAVWILSPWFGDPPFLFATEHVVNHHAMDNSPKDLSCTMGYQRDSVWGFGHYLLNYFLGTSGLFGLIKIFREGRGSKAWRNRFYGGQVVFWTLVAVRLSQDFWATAIILLGSFLALQCFNRANNWTEHAFINPDCPLDPLGNSYTIINSKSNGGIGANEGYHASHHIKAGMPNHLWPKHFQDNVAAVCNTDHLVFQDLSTTALFFLLMRRDYATMARHYVNLPGKERTAEEVIALLKLRVQPFCE